MVWSGGRYGEMCVVVISGSCLAPYIKEESMKREHESRRKNKKQHER